MSFYSTNKQTPLVSLKEAVVKGLADDNGLFMPTHIPQLPAAFFEQIETLSLQEISLEVAATLLKDEISKEELRPIVEESMNFEIPVVPVHDNIYALELFHGPTHAFKDVGARFMARLLAKRMGLPVHKFIAATNSNDIVPAYLQTGHFIPRPSAHTISNAMDVGNPSNFARLMDMYDNSLEKIRQEVVGYRYSDEETRQLMRQVYQEHGYTLDPHGAIGYGALRDYLQDKPKLTGIFLETAHPAKFIEVVEETIPVKVTIPENLQQAMARPKESIRMAAEEEALKNFLISRA